MAYRVDIKRVMGSKLIRDFPQVIAGCALAAFATDAFMIPNGLAAGGVTGLATIVQAAAAQAGVDIPVGFQTIVINALLLLVVARSGGALYVAQTISGFVLLGGMVLRCGSNTGGSDTIGQILSRRTSLPVGSTVMAIDVAVCAASIPVFSLENALYAALSMVLMGIVVDAVVDGGNRRRMAFIISGRHEDIATDIVHELGRGCTRVSAQGIWSGEDRPMLMVILERRELASLKTIVAEHDRDAIMIISDVTEAFGEGFKELGA